MCGCKGGSLSISDVRKRSRSRNAPAERGSKKSLKVCERRKWKSEFLAAQIYRQPRWLLLRCNPGRGATWENEWAAQNKRLVKTSDLGGKERESREHVFGLSLSMSTRNSKKREGRRENCRIFRHRVANDFKSSKPELKQRHNVVRSQKPSSYVCYGL